LYSIWVRIDETLPWFELKGDYGTREEAKQAAQRVTSKMAIKLVNLSQKRKPIESLITVRARS
jgi:hypothetical protein